MPFIVVYLAALLYNTLISWETFGARGGTEAFVLLVAAVIFEQFRWSFAGEF
jgi:hypothetical protein